MPGYDKSKNPHHPKRKRGTFSDDVARWFDTVEDVLFSDTSDLWYGIVLSGENSQLVPTKNQSRQYFHTAEIVDLGDGVGRYKVRIQIMSSAYATNVTSPTDCYGDIRNKKTKADRASLVDTMLFAYTESVEVLPTFGASVLVLNLGGTYFIKLALNKSLTLKGTSYGSGDGQGSEEKFKKGKPPVYKPGSIQPPSGWDKAWLPVPSPQFYQTSGHGYRNVKVGRKWHPGVDFSNYGKQGTAIVCILDGIVVRNRYSGGYGNSVEIYHQKENLISMYNHMQKRSSLKVGASVSQKDVIGAVGSTGVSTGGHLHLEIWKPVNASTKLDTTKINEAEWEKNYLKQRGKGVKPGTLKCKKDTPFCPVDPLKEPELIGWTLLPKDKKKYKHGRRPYGYITE